MTLVVTGKLGNKLRLKTSINIPCGVTDENRIIILDLLSKEDLWYVDGTFNISPDKFTLVFIVKFIINNKNLPLVYALLPNKEKVSYSKMFEYLVSNVFKKPKYIMSDFEKGITSCVKKFLKVQM